jgi:hypothetical protein
LENHAPAVKAGAKTINALKSPPFVKFAKAWPNGDA